MQAADTPQVEREIQAVLANESTTKLLIIAGDRNPPPRLTLIDSRRITECLRENTRLRILLIHSYDIHNAAVLNVFRNGLPLCTAVTTVILKGTNLTNADLDRLRPAFYNTCVTKLVISDNNIQGQRGGELLRDLMVGNSTVVVLSLSGNPIGPEGSLGLGLGLADGNNRLQNLYLSECQIGNDGLASLLLPMDEKTINNNSLTHLHLCHNHIAGAEGGRQVGLLLRRFPRLKVLDLDRNPIGPLGARALAPGLLAAAAASRLQVLGLNSCQLGNDGVASLILPDDDGQQVVNRSSLTNLDLSSNGIQGAEGGRQVSLLLQRFPTLKVLNLNGNVSLGDLGAGALAPGLEVATSRLEVLDISNCGLDNDGVASLVPDGQVNRSLTNLNLQMNHIHGDVGGENVIELAARCTNLDHIQVPRYSLSRDQRRRLNLLVLGPKRLITEASCLGGSTFSVLFRFVEKAHRHEHGLSAIFVILQNDGEDCFCTANNRAVESAAIVPAVDIMLRRVTVDDDDDDYISV